VLRAVMEGVACSLRDCLTIVAEQGVALEQVRLTGGGARSALWRQIVADVLGTELVDATHRRSRPGVCQESGLTS
jgi:xylulokinase